MADLFDRGAAPGKVGRRFDATTPCPWNGCGRPVEGIDPMRTCPSCRAGGAPPRAPWSMAKTTTCTVLPELVLELANAHLSEAAVHAPLPAESSITVGPPPEQLHLGEAA